MKKIIILGAGQMGRMASKLINECNYELIAYGDNNPAAHGEYCGVKVTSVEAAVNMGADFALLGVLDDERASELASQAVSLGFKGEFLYLSHYHKLQDIRAGVFKMLADRLKDVEGDIAELGVYKGDFARILNAAFPKKALHLFDTFEGFDERDTKIEKENSFSYAKEGDFSDTGVEKVLGSLPYPERAVVHKGFFPETAVDGTFALVSMDVDLYAPTLAGLEHFYPRLAHGGAIILHDYNNARFSGAHAAIEEFERKNGRLALVPLCDLHGSAVIIKP